MKLDLTPLGHAAIAVAAQVLVGLTTGNLLAGTLLALGIFVGRENAQAEYRWISAFGAGKRINMPWWGGFDPRVWGDIGSWLDVLAPTLAVVFVAVSVFFWSVR